MDVTETVQNLYAEGTNTFDPSNDVFTDGWYGTVKALSIVYANATHIVTQVTGEDDGKTISIPAVYGSDAPSGDTEAYPLSDIPYYNFY